MKSRILILYSLFLALQGGSICYAQKRIDTSSYLANLIWNNAPNLGHFDYNERIGKYTSDFPTLEEKEKFREGWVELKLQSEIYSLLYRNWGINFWETFSDDKRKFTWYLNTVMSPPKYYKNVRQGVANSFGNSQLSDATDSVALSDWNTRNAVYKKEFLQSPFVSKAEKQNFIQYELINERVIAKIRANRFKEKFNYLAWIRRYMQYINSLSVDTPVYSSLINGFVNNVIISMTRTYKDFGMTTQDMKLFLSIASKSPVVKIQEAVVGSLSMLALYNEPFVFKHRAHNGKSVDFNKMRGKVVLFDFWSNGCVSCIQYMPRIKPIYEKYKDKGFEVISVNNGGRDKFKRAVEIYNIVGADWPLVVIENWDEYQAKYGWRGVPQLLLFNKQGLLEEYNSNLFNEKSLETQVKKLLAKE